MRVGASARARATGETIYAVATARGRAGVSVTRVSGPNALEALRLARAMETSSPSSTSSTSRANDVDGRLRYRAFVHPNARAGEPPLDVGFVATWRAPRSFTGEDVVEFHGHGSVATQRALLDALGTIDGFRHAEAGEFARRAFRNGKMDLTAAEGLADLLDAETEAQRRQAMRLTANGTQRAMYERWRDELMTCAAHCEAVIDFGEEEDVSGDVVERDVLTRATALRETLRKHLDAPARGEMIRRGVRVAIVGAPNVGKSSMLNALAGRDAAIVSPRAGTTRDVLEISLELNGYKVIVSDTAGIRETDDDVEKMGVARAPERAQDADVLVALADASSDASGDAARDALSTVDVTGKDVITVWNKSDVIDAARARELDALVDDITSRGGDARVVSARDGRGVDDFIATLARVVARKCERASVEGDDDDALAVTRSRHRVNLTSCVAALERAARRAPVPLELRAEDFRLAARALARVTGSYDVEDVLDVVFRDFCVGK